jgi:hypothetical protein
MLDKFQMGLDMEEDEVAAMATRNNKGAGLQHAVGRNATRRTTTDVIDTSALLSNRHDQLAAADHAYDETATDASDGDLSSKHESERHRDAAASTAHAHDIIQSAAPHR